MKKFALLLPVLLLTACATQPQPIITPDVISEHTTRTGEYTYTFQMSKPDLLDSSNRESIISGFYQDRNLNYKITKEDFDLYNANCSDSEKEENTEIATHNGDGYFSRSLSKEDIKIGNTITLTGYYKSEPLLQSLTDTQKSQIANKGRTIVPIDRLNHYYPTDYDKNTANFGYSNDEERIINSQKIAGRNDPATRYPFHTPLITEDLLLHIYHKVFDNSLKYYEEQIARPTLANLAEKLSKQYQTLAQKEKNTEIKQIYDFLSAYRAVPQILLPSQSTLKTEIENLQKAQDNREISDLTDDQIQTIIKSRTEEITKNLFPTYQNLIPKVLDKILKAQEARGQDDFMMTFGKDFFKQADTEIQQDYTQFQPRSHYNDSSLLKTYFIATKRLMREKFYFNSPKLAQVAMIMAITTPDAELKEFNDLQNQIKNLIGMDDDLTLNEMKSFLKSKGLTSVSAILSADINTLISELSSLHPQKITSTHYQTAEIAQFTEDEAKQMLDGFVFFGEKFTLDSYIFDQMTAGSAEEEFSFKPNLQTAFIVPDILTDNSIAHQLVKQWMSRKSKSNPPKILENSQFTQLSSYDVIASEAKQSISSLLTSNSSVIDNIYHTRLSLLSLLIDLPFTNSPYFRLDPAYQLKSLITYMGSYTELKHDTLLYVKQSYAEMGAGGPNACAIYVNQPDLPVPHGYIEAEPDFLDGLISLVDKTINSFNLSPNNNNEIILSNFTEYSNILKKLKTISIQQMTNEKISDDDFEWMRTEFFNLLMKIIYPLKTFGEPSQNETRSALIADIFTSEADGPLYTAIGRPALLILNVADTNGTRTVIGPVYTHYEFYASDQIIQDSTNGRYTDQDRQTQLQSEEYNERTNPDPIPNRSNSAKTTPN